MITLEYEKRFPISMVSHIDMLRVMNRVFNRAELPLEYSKGFNPHAIIFFSPALSLGVESVCEYVTVGTSCETQGLIQRLNEVSPHGLLFKRAFFVNKNPNLAAATAWAKYKVAFDDLNALDIRLLKEHLEKDYFITYLEKGEPCTKNISDSVKEVSMDSEGFTCMLACGNKNLKADRFVKGVLANFALPCDNLAILKTEMFTDKLIPIDVFLKGFAQKELN